MYTTVTVAPLSAAQQVEAMRVCMPAPEEVLSCKPEVAELSAGTDSEGEEVPDVAVDYDAV